MIKKSIIFFLVLACLNFVIAPECSFASSKYFEGHIDPVPDKSVAIAVAVGLVVIVVGVVLLVKHARKQPVQRQDQQQKPTDTISSEINDEQFTRPSDQIALLRW
jgi:hypothetical protein